MIEQDIQAVRAVLQKFQEGYDRRDVSALGDFRSLFVNAPAVEVIGTGGIAAGDDEWCIGPDAALRMVENDWKGWGDLRLNVAEARISVWGDAAWLATTGTVNSILKRDETYQNYLESLRSILDDQETSARSRLFSILRGGSNTLFEAEKGDDYTWPIRFTAVLVRQEGQWRYHQMQFSFATTRFPDVRSL